MKHPTLIPHLLCLAGLACAEKVPVLLDPKVISIPGGTTVQAFSDSAFVAGRGRTGQYVRKTSGISVVYEHSDPEMDQEFPCIADMTVYSGSEGWSIPDQMGVGASDTLLPLDFKRGVRNGSGSAIYLPGKGATRYLFCGSKGVFYFERRTNSNTGLVESVLLDSLPPTRDVLDTAAPLLCSIDNSKLASAIRTAIFIPFQMGYAVVSDTTSTASLLSYGRKDTLPVSKLDWVLGGDQYSWLAFSNERSMLYWATPARLGHKIDSIRVPGLSAAATRSAHVERKDSLVVFAVDSQIVFLKWNPAGIGILKTISIPGERFTSASGSVRSAIGWSQGPVGYLDTGYVWATTGSKLYSFRLSWQEDATGVIGTGVQAFSGAGTSLRSMSGGTEVVWNGPGTARAEFLSADGRRLGSLDLVAGQARTWISPRPGLVMVRTPDGVRSIVVR